MTLAPPDLRGPGAPPPADAAVAAAVVEQTSRAGTTTLRSYARFVGRHRRLVLAAVVLGTFLGTGVTLQQPAVSTAVTRIALTPQESSPGADLDRPRLISLDSDAQVLTSAAVLAVAAADSDYPGGQRALEDAVAVSAVADTRILVLRVSDPDPALAIRASDAIADEFLASRGAAATLRANQSRGRLEDQAASVAERLANLQSSAVGGVLVGSDLLEERELTATLTALQAELARAVTSAQDPGRVVLPPTVLRPGGRPMGIANVASGALLGLAAGLALAALRDQVAAMRRRPAAARRA